MKRMRRLGRLLSCGVIILVSVFFLIVGPIRYIRHEWFWTASPFAIPLGGSNRNSVMNYSFR